MQLRGDWPEAIEEARLAIERFGHVLEPTATAFALYQQGEIQRLRGEFVEAESAYRRASELGRVPQPGLALLRLEQGQPDVAAAAIRQVVGATSDPYVRTRYLPAAVEILIATGDVAGATEAAREIEAMAAGKGNPVLDAMAAHAAGSVRLAETDARHAVEPLRRAFEGWQSIGAPYLAARIRVQIGAALDTLGDRDGAQLEREAAAKVFRELGAAPDLARLEVPAPGAAKAPDQTYGLTTRELEVLRLLARGGTNREMAEALFLSEKTIDRHVSNIFTKLDVHTRAAATAFAYEHRLL
jgi:DNA-binding NarL/FixJ family response regulator